jgi:hypothetical protein
MTQNTIVRSVVISRKPQHRRPQHRKPLSSLAVKGLKWKMADLADVRVKGDGNLGANNYSGKSWVREIDVVF